MKTLKIYHDAVASPLEDFDSLGTLAYKHSRYCLGHEEFRDTLDWLSEKTGKLLRAYTSEEVERLEEAFYAQYVSLPLYLYDHGSITMNTTGFHCPWDSWQVGYIYISLEKIREEYSVKRVSKRLREKVKELLKHEVHTFDLFIRGEVYGFQIEENGEIIDSCSGFYGDDWDTNGIKDYIPEELWPQLEGIRVEYDY